MTKEPITILGAGSWGTALALHLARSGQDVYLWTLDTAHIDAMIKEHANNRYLPGYELPNSIHPTADLKTAVDAANDILIAVPSIGFRSVLLKLKPLLNASKRILWATKGIDFETKHLLHELAYEIFGEQYPLAVLSGPSYAKEVAKGLPTAVVIASENKIFANDLVKRFNHQTFRTYLSTDVIGVEVCGAVKNVLAIAIGISDGMGMGANARSALITRGLAEITRLGLALGGKSETFVGLAGLGDLVLTCTDDQSRNRRFGLALGKGKKPAEAEAEIKQVVEGKQNAELVVALAKKHHIEMPITETVLDILQNKLALKDVMQHLMSRVPKIEG